MKKSTLVFFILSCSLFADAQSIQDAKKFTDNEQYENATEVYKALIETKFADPTVYYYYAENLLLSDNPDSARIIFEKGKALDANHPLIKIGNAKILMDKISVREAKFASDQDPSNADLQTRYTEAQDNIKEAESLIDNAVSTSNDINVLIEAAEAMLQYKNKNTDKAKTILDKASGIDQKNIDVLLLYGDLYGELNNGTLAADYYNKALDLNKASARAIVSKGKLYYRSTNYDGAAREFQDAIKLEPSYAPAYRWLGEAYIKLGKLQEGTDAYKKYLELTRSNCAGRIRYATFLYAAKNYSESIAELRQINQKCDPNNVTMLRTLGYSYWELKDTLNGMETMEKLISVLPADKRVTKDFEYYGKFKIASSKDSSNVVKGIENLQKAFELDPNRTDLLLDIANAWYRIKNYSKAIEVLNQKISLNKDPKPTDYYMLGRAYYFNRQFVEADTAMKKVNEITPTYASGWLTRAQINAQIDSTSKAGLAKPFYEKYDSLALADPGNSAKYRNGQIEVYSYLINYYDLKKDKAKEIYYLKLKKELVPDPDDKKALQRAIDFLEGKPNK
jgi:tetratricopeptide (TPR) repeat protein